ncbi:MAG: T9SS type B sorting domain-containing protein [Pedobacter sp.]|nr:MAG: T9SS type B sorting domain-containing protein [Pedobacter sp.]
MKTKTLTLLFLVFSCFPALAVDFIVTTNADSGPGTLREALTLAATNGAAETDRITFNMPGNSEADRTIVVLTEFPEISSNLTIDGTTQPGNAFGNSNAKVMLQPNYDTYQQTERGSGAFRLANVNHVEIYGLVFDQFYQLRNRTGGPGGGTGITLLGATDVVIGSPGKGNVFILVEYGISANPSLQTGLSSSNIKIQSNSIGIGLDDKPITRKRQGAVYLVANNVVFGGSDSSYGNQVAGRQTDYGSQFEGENHTLSYNRFGPPGDLALELESEIIHLSAVKLDFTDNVAALFSMVIAGAQINLLRNKEMGTDRLLVTPSIAMNNASDINIGNDNPADANLFLSSERLSAIVNTGSARVAVRINSIQCTPHPYSIVNAAGVEIKVLINSDTEYSGTAIPSTDIYIYNDNSRCKYCSPVNFYTKVKTDAAGKWRITGNFTDNRFVSNATLIHTSSEYTQPQFGETATVGWFTKSDPGCGLSNGSIEVSNPMHLLKIEWYNVAGNVKLGEGVRIENLPPGQYYAIGYNGKCSTRSPSFATLTANTGSQSYFPIKTVKDASCGNDNGSITVTFGTNPPKSIKWTAALTETVIARTGSISKLAPGFYNLYLTGDNGCEFLFETYEVKTLPPILLDEGAVVITNDQCGSKSGSISGITISGGIAPYTYEWSNANGAIVGTTAELKNLAAGIYSLKIFDSNNCSQQGLNFTIQPQQGFLPDPVVNPVQICAPGVATIIPEKISNGRFNLYASLNTDMPVATSQDIFQLNVSKNTTYYISHLTGTCESSRIPVQVIVGESTLNVTNTFSPNDDGINDTWNIKDLILYPEFILRVFNRNGQVVFTTTDPHFKFDGTNKGATLPVGVYYYFLKLREGCSTLTGSLTLIR